jgi:hypothetical protein
MIQDVKLMAVCLPALLVGATVSGQSEPGHSRTAEDPLPPPMLLEREALEAGNPLATYASLLDLEERYRQSPFAPIYDEVRFNFEQFLGIPDAGVRAMSLPAFRTTWPDEWESIQDSWIGAPALDVIEREAKATRIVIWGEEHHLPQTRSLYEPILRALGRQGYRYLAAETFTDDVMQVGYRQPDFGSGYYLRDPVYAEAVRTALELGFELIAYDTTQRGPDGDGSFRDRTQAEKIKALIFDRDPEAKVLIFAGRAHASEWSGSDGWTPMASVLKGLTGIDPLTLYAPTMGRRLTPEEEHPLYRDATDRELVSEPTIFVDGEGEEFLGPGFCDAYVFWPRMTIVDGRPDWLAKTLGRTRIEIPAPLRVGNVPRLVQAYRPGALASSIPVDQVMIVDADDVSVLMLPKGDFLLRTIDRNSKVLGEAAINVR